MVETRALKGYPCDRGPFTAWTLTISLIAHWTSSSDCNSMPVPPFGIELHLLKALTIASLSGLLWSRVVNTDKHNHMKTTAAKILA